MNLIDDFHQHSLDYILKHILSHGIEISNEWEGRKKREFLKDIEDFVLGPSKLNVTWVIQTADAEEDDKHHKQYSSASGSSLPSNIAVSKVL